MLSNYSYKKIISGLIGISSFFMLVTSASAAKLFLQPVAASDTPGQFTVDIMLDPEHISINAIEGVLELPKGVTVTGSNDASSVIGMWVGTPTQEGQSVSFSGVIPNGFEGLINPFHADARSPGVIARLSLAATTEGEQTFYFSGVHGYANDGTGTEVPILAGSDTFALFASDVSATEDHNAPLEFTPEVVKDPLLFDNEYALVFAGRDLESGIDHYEVKEGGRAWQRATSPYLLIDQKLRGEILVKAIDRAGNSRVESVIFEKKMGDNLTRNILISLGILTILTLMIIFRKKIGRRFFPNVRWFMVLGLGVFLPWTARAALITITPTTGSYEVGTTFTATISVSSTTQSVNAASGVLSYPAQYLDIVGISKSGSILDQWLPPGTSGPVVKTAQGVIQFEGVGIAGYQGKNGKLFSVTFKAKKEGEAALALRDTVLLANDGEGTRIPVSNGSAIYRIIPRAPVEEPAPIPEPAPEEVIVETPTPEVPAVVTLPAPEPRFMIRHEVSVISILMAITGLLLLIILFLVAVLVRALRKIDLLEEQIIKDLDEEHREHHHHKKVIKE